MDRYEYKLKTEQIQKLVARKEYKAALQIAETIDWRKVKDVKILSSAAEAYVAAKRYEDALDLLEQAYENAPLGRRIIYRLTEVAILAKDAETAGAYLDEFKKVAPKDSGQYILEYRLARLQGESPERRIAILEEYQQQEFDERWSYELARLYAENGRIDDCVKLCDDIVLWFSLGKYVEKALALKAKYAPLSESQQDRVKHSESYAGVDEEAQDDMPEQVSESEKVQEEEETSKPEEEASGSEEEETAKGMKRLKFPGFSWLFRGGAADDEEESEEEVLEEGNSEEETSEEETSREEAAPDLAAGPVSDAADEYAQTEAEEEWSEVVPEETETGKEDITPEKAETPEDNPEDEIPDEEEYTEEVFRTEDDTEWLSAPETGSEEELFAEPEKEPEPGASGKVRTELSPEEELERLLQDPSVRTAVETGDVFSALIRPAEEEPAQAGEEDAMLEGQLEFDFRKMDALARAKEEREKELGIWDDPFRELVMQEPEEEQQVRLIFSSTEEELIRQAESRQASVDESEECPDEPEGVCEGKEELAEEAAEAESAEEEAEQEILEEESKREEAEQETSEEACEKEEVTQEASEEECEEEEAEQEASEEEPEEEALQEVSEEASGEEEAAQEPAAQKAVEEKTEDEPAKEEKDQPVDEMEEALRLIEAEVHRALAEDAMETSDSGQPVSEEKEEPKPQESVHAEGLDSETVPEPKEEAEEEKTEDEPEKKIGALRRETRPWSRHNMLVRSENMKAGFELAMGYLLRLPAEERMPSVARTSGDKLNRKNWEDLEERLKDRILIVEYADEMDDVCLEHLRDYLTREGSMAVLIDTEENIAEIGLRNKPLLDMFPTEYAYYEYSNEEIVHHGVEYAESLGWSLDDMAMLAYYAAVENMPDVQPGRELIEAENIIDDAIEMAGQKLIGRLIKGAFAGKKEKGNILREVHFKNH